MRTLKALPPPSAGSQKNERSRGSVSSGARLYTFGVVLQLCVKVTLYPLHRAVSYKAPSAC